jgi:hypothetical protein
MKKQVGDNRGTCTWHEILGMLELDAASAATQYYTHIAFDKETIENREKSSNTATNYHLLFSLPKAIKRVCFVVVVDK